MLASELGAGRSLVPQELGEVVLWIAHVSLAQSQSSPVTQTGPLRIAPSQPGPVGMVEEWPWPPPRKESGLGRGCRRGPPDLLPICMETHKRSLVPDALRYELPVPGGGDHPGRHGEGDVQLFDPDEQAMLPWSRIGRFPERADREQERTRFG